MKHYIHLLLRSLLFSLPSVCLAYIIHTGGDAGNWIIWFSAMGIFISMLGIYSSRSFLSFLPRKKDRRLMNGFVLAAFICFLTAIVFLLKYWSKIYTLEKKEVLRLSSIVSLGLAFTLTFKEWSEIKRWERVVYFLTLATVPPALISLLFY